MQLGARNDQKVTVGNVTARNCPELKLRKFVYKSEELLVKILKVLILVKMLADGCRGVHVGFPGLGSAQW